MNRKELVQKISEHLGVKSKYQGAPSFAYVIESKNEKYTVERDGSIKTEQDQLISLNDILVKANEIQDEPLEEEGKLLRFSFKGHTGRTLQNVVNMISSKQTLIIKALDLDQGFMDETFAKDLEENDIDTLEEFKAAIEKSGVDRCNGVEFDFENELYSIVLNKEIEEQQLVAFKELLKFIDAYAKKLKRASYKRSQEDNPKYAFRTWLIRLGMNGKEFKDSRKVLLSKLEGSSAFRTVTSESEVNANG